MVFTAWSVIPHLKLMAEMNLLLSGSDCLSGASRIDVPNPPDVFRLGIYWSFTDSSSHVIVGHEKMG